MHLSLYIYIGLIRTGAVVSGSPEVLRKLPLSTLGEFGLARQPRPQLPQAGGFKVPLAPKCRLSSFLSSKRRTPQSKLAHVHEQSEFTHGG